MFQFSSCIVTFSRCISRIIDYFNANCSGSDPQVEAIEQSEPQRAATQTAEQLSSWQKIAATVHIAHAIAQTEKYK